MRASTRLEIVSVGCGTDQEDLKKEAEGCGIKGAT
jgi:hypothetical protein